MNTAHTTNAASRLLLSTLLVTFTLTAVSTSAPAAAANSPCPEGERYLALAKKSGAQQDLARAVGWLERSVNACDSYDAWHLMGVALQRQREFEKALNAYRQAVEHAPSSDSAAISTARYGQVLALNGQRFEALTTLERAMEMHAQPPAWIRTAAKEIDLSIVDEPISRESIKRSLSNQEFGLLARSTPRSFAAKIGIPLNFEFDSTSLDALTKANLTQLGSVLAEPKYAGNTFTLIGHSDVRGEESYNYALSESRAKSISDALITQYPNLEGRLTVNGAGEMRPKYRGPQTSEDEHRLNRRLEVLVN